MDPVLVAQLSPSSELPVNSIMHSNSKETLQPPKRRLSTRRGSISASDPWGTHSQLNLNPNLSSSSTLTIVRVTSPPISPPSITLRDPPSSPALHHRRNHRRHGSGSSVGSNSSQTSRQDHSSSRLSFAFSSFLGNHGSGPASNNSRPESPTSSRARPSSPNTTRQSHSHSFSHPRMSADQLVDLARQSTNPRHITPSHTPASYSPGPASPCPETAPASFIPMDDDVWLPFIDRPMEVYALISSPPSAKLFSLLAQTFPRSEGQQSPSITALAALPKEVNMADFPPDPTTWTFMQLYRWLTTVPRTSAPDVLWVHHARACILARSELIWERVKGALGVPPELDINEEEEDDRQHDVFAEWATTTVGVHEMGYSTAHRASPEGADAQDFVTSPVDVESDPELNALSLSIENIMALSTPVVPAPSSHSGHLPPLSLPPSLAGTSALSHSPLVVDVGLQDISEDQEETDEGPNASENDWPQKQVNTTQADYTTARPLQDAPPQETIQGLKISTAPLPSSPMVPAITSPITISHSLSHSLHPPTHSVSSSPSQKVNPLLTASPSRSFSHFSSSPHARPRSVRTSSFGSVHSTCSSAAYDPVGDRVPGNPLFPSNFARLAVGPTLRANNPSLRSPPYPPLPAYPFLRGLGAGRRPSWAESWDPVKQEYAVTAGSEGSVAEHETVKIISTQDRLRRNRNFIPKWRLRREHEQYLDAQSPMPY